MTYHRPLFTGNVLKVRLSCVKPSKKKQKEKSAKKITVSGKNQDRGRIYTPALSSDELFSFDTPPSKMPINCIRQSCVKPFFLY